MANMLARLRTANVPYDELVRAAAELYESAPPPARRTFDKLLPPVPEWAVTSVLLSPDLIPHLFASLEAKDCAAARVCKAWRQGWVDTLHLRRGLRQGRSLTLHSSGLMPCSWQSLQAVTSCSWLRTMRRSS